jgi:cyclic pyranopterin phosphate synthase
MKLVIEITQKCNLTCDYCLTRESSAESLSQDYILQTISQLNVSKLLISGGEPTLSKDLQHIINAIRTKYTDIYISVSTHGLHTSRILDIASSVDRFEISLPTLNDALYRTLRGGGSINCVKNSILKLLEYDTEVRVHFMFTKLNYLEWKDVFDWCNGNVNTIRISRYWPFRNAYFIKNKYELSEKLLQIELDRIRNEDYIFDIIYPYNNLDVLTHDYLVMDSNGNLFNLRYGDKFYITM